MQEKAERTYDIKPQDFIPLVGSFLYQTRNRKDDENGRPRTPKPYIHYLGIGAVLTLLDVASSSAIVYGAVKGLEALLK